MVSKVSLFDMPLGDSLIAEINRTFKGRRRNSVLDLVKQLELYNSMYGENLTLREYIVAYQLMSPVFEPEKGPK